MNNALTALPTTLQGSKAGIGSSLVNQGSKPLYSGSPADPIGKSGMSWSDVLKVVHGTHKGGHHGGGGGLNAVASSTDSGDDAFGVADATSNTSTDAFGTPSSTMSSTSSLIASITDPFSSIASQLSAQAQLQSQQLLDL